MALKKILRIVASLIGVAVIAYLIVSIGPQRILQTVAHVNPLVLAAMLATQVLGLFVRSKKYTIYLKDRDPLSRLEVFTYSRLGGEVSTLFFFSPLAKKIHRNAHTAGILVLDRFLEIGMTLVAAIVAIVIIGNTHPLIPFLFAAAAIQLCLVAFFVLQPIALPTQSKYRLVNKLLSVLSVIRKNRVQPNRKTAKLMFLIFMGTMLDFLNVFLGFLAIGQAVNPLFIPLIWTGAATMGILTMINIGPGEATWIYLFYLLHHIAKEATSAMIVLTRSINAAALVGLYGFLVIFRHKKRTTATAADTIKKNTPPRNASAPIE
jgi:hypothetical protein